MDLKDNQVAHVCAGARTPTNPPSDDPFFGSGFVRLVDHMGSDLSIVRSARVSHDADWRAGEDKGGDARLINYLYKNRHTTPFESITFTFEVKAPYFVLRQWHRHRTQSYNEVSARYTELPEDYYVPLPAHIGSQSETNKQGREIAVGRDTAVGLDANEIWVSILNDQLRGAFVIYHGLLSEGCPKELARSVLPAATFTRMFATMNLHNLFHFLGLRLHPHAQWEIQEYAKGMLWLIAPIVPVATKAFLEHSPAISDEMREKYLHYLNWYAVDITK